MSKKRRPRRPYQRPSPFDIGFEEIFNMGPGPDAGPVSASDIFLTRCFLKASKGDARSLKVMLDVLEKNERARQLVEPRGVSSWPQRTARKIIPADQAAQLLGIAAAPGADAQDHLQVLPWAIESALERLGPFAASRLNWRPKFVWPVDRPLPAPWRLPPALPVTPRGSASTQWPKRKSGNYAGAPRKAPACDVPFDQFLNSKLTVTIKGKRRKLTAPEALLHQANIRALNGDEEFIALLEKFYVKEIYARFMRREHIGSQIIRDGPDAEMCDDPFASFLRGLKIASRRTTRRVKLEPWIVMEALARMPEGTLTVEEQQVVVRSTSAARRVVWPHWWSVRP